MIRNEVGIKLKSMVVVSTFAESNDSKQMEILDQENISKPKTLRYATFNQRVLATVFDFMILMIPMSIIAYYQYGEKNFNIALGVSIILALYKPIMEGTYGATWGKMALGLLVVDDKLNPIRIAQSFNKNGVYIIRSAMGILLLIWLFRNEAFLETENMVDALKVAEENPYALVASLWNVLLFVSSFSMINALQGQTLHDRLGKTFCIVEESL